MLLPNFYHCDPMSNYSKTSCFRLLFIFAIAITVFGHADPLQAQRKKEKRLATVTGIIKNDARKSFRVSYDEIKTSLRKVVTPTAPPVPSGFEKKKVEDRRKWLADFYATARGKAYLKNQEKELNDAPSFDVKYNDDGDFTVYDVPPGEYGLQGRIDKEIDGILYGFEVFARIKVLKDVDQINLQSIPVVITPLFKQGQPAPPLDVLTAKGKKLNYDLDAYKGHYIFLNFMNTTDLTPGYQQSVQDMYKAISKSHKVKLISIVLDEDRKVGEARINGKDSAIKWLIKKKFTGGSYAFTEGWENNTLEAYGVRSTPSGWLISDDEDRKIMMSQHEFFKFARVKKSITEIVKDRISGTDTPTLATPPENAGEAEDKK